MYQEKRVISGMRPTGPLHLGHYHGVLSMWLKLQADYPCLFFVADYHALTTHYQNSAPLPEYIQDIVIDWLAVGLDPEQSILFIQSHVMEHAELFLLLSMITPLGWLERVPTYKEQQQKLVDFDLSTYGFLGYPLLQAADILLYRASHVPVGEDQIPHIELTREVARRFNTLYGREPDFREHALMASRKMGAKRNKLYNQLRNRYQEKGDEGAYEAARALIMEQQNLSSLDRERLLGYLAGVEREILVEPEELLSDFPKFPGIDGQKMSKSYGNAIGLRESRESVDTKIRRMPTDPARVRRTDPGDPLKCPVFQLHKVYSDDEVCSWVIQHCPRATIGCLDCKQPLIDKIQSILDPIRERAAVYEEDRILLRNVLADGCERASSIAKETMEDVKSAINMIME